MQPLGAVALAALNRRCRLYQHLQLRPHRLLRRCGVPWLQRASRRLRRRAAWRSRRRLNPTSSLCLPTPFLIAMPMQQLAETATATSMQMSLECQCRILASCHCPQLSRPSRRGSQRCSAQRLAASAVQPSRCRPLHSPRCCHSPTTQSPLRLEVLLPLSLRMHQHRQLQLQMIERSATVSTIARPSARCTGRSTARLCRAELPPR